MEDSAQKLTHVKSVRPPADFCDRIILAITLEKELRQTKRVLYSFVVLLFASLATIPFSTIFFINQWKNSGISYFIFTALENSKLFFVLWQDFVLSIFDSLPILGIVLLSINVALLLFTLRLFLYKKGLLLKYLHHSFA